MRACSSRAARAPLAGGEAAGRGTAVPLARDPASQALIGGIAPGGASGACGGAAAAGAMTERGRGDDRGDEAAATPQSASCCRSQHPGRREGGRGGEAWGAAPFEVHGHPAVTWSLVVLRARGGKNLSTVAQGACDPCKCIQVLSTGHVILHCSEQWPGQASFLLPPGHLRVINVVLGS